MIKLIAQHKAERGHDLSNDVTGRRPAPGAVEQAAGVREKNRARMDGTERLTEGMKGKNSEQLVIFVLDNLM